MAKITTCEICGREMTSGFFSGENEYLDTIKSDGINPVWLHPVLEQAIRDHHDDRVLPAFNCWVFCRRTKRWLWPTLMRVLCRRLVMQPYALKISPVDLWVYQYLWRNWKRCNTV